MIGTLNTTNTMSYLYKSLTSDKKIEFASIFNDGRFRVYINNLTEPLYVLPAESSTVILKLSAFDIVIYNYPKKDMMIVNKWPNEVFVKAN